MFLSFYIKCLVYRKNYWLRRYIENLHITRINQLKLPSHIWLLKYIVLYLPSKNILLFSETIVLLKLTFLIKEMFGSLSWGSNNSKLTWLTKVKSEIIILWVCEVFLKKSIFKFFFTIFWFVRKYLRLFFYLIINFIFLSFWLRIKIKKIIF